MELAMHPNELLILFNRDSAVSMKTLAFAKTVSNHIRDMEFRSLKFPNTIWKELLNMLNLEAKDILDKSHPDYQKKIMGHDFSTEGWLNVLSHNSYLIKAPIAVKNGKAVLCNRPKDVLKLINEEDKIPVS
jgi:arsenate reductase